ncbi:MAG: ABC transporter ATP-binding protein [Kosmotoga sp.]|uniref:ABC transporter ATP-binding protein n=1 Tax=Kosmotoga sp. TaxID=1955248 RepID=UPI001E043E61|nr:ABC transporter ATP-binding protein [Kosmotoga sp.]MBO8166523.1 ABC transporter ATP-binding protein [Kosmotoga sp.]
MERHEMNEPVSVRGLKKYYGNTKAVDGIDFNVKLQEVHALLGPNGAGKTTTLKSILGFVRYEGNIKVFGKEIDHTREKIAFVPDEKNFYKSLTGLQAIEMCKRLFEDFREERAKELFETFQLPLKKRIGTFSHGMKTQAYLALIFARQAQLYIFDELTWGLDPIKRDDVLEMVRDLVINGSSVLYTSHIIPEVERIADRITIMHKGKIHFSGFLDEIKERFLVLKSDCQIDLKKYNVVSAFRYAGFFTFLVDTKGQSLYPEKCECHVPDLNEFFQIVIRGERNVL